MIHNNSNAANPIISVEEARKILGDKHQQMTDEEVLQIIGTLDLIAKDALARAKVNRKEDSDQQGH
jgi:hypothetical protein